MVWCLGGGIPAVYAVLGTGLELTGGGGLSGDRPRMSFVAATCSVTATNLPAGRTGASLPASFCPRRLMQPRGGRRLDGLRVWNISVDEARVNGFI